MLTFRCIAELQTEKLIKNSNTNYYMAKSLVIVESPAKAKTIEKYLGKDFKVASSIGHIRDLPKSDKAIDIENGFIPTYEISTGKKKTVAELRKLAKAAETIWLATDEDREGEAIAWHLYEALNLNKSNTKRIVFNEITKSAILKAIENPREVNKNIVDAQQARRVLDRLIGFELSPVLWKKVKYGLSAGRVQSVAARIVAEREREIDSFKSKSLFKVTSQLTNKNQKNFKAELTHRFEEAVQAEKFLDEVNGSELTVSDLQKKPSKRTPAAPFTTSTLQQEASRKLGFSVKQTMVVAQKLYETGKITYMRTDSLNLSQTALDQAKNLINLEYGSEYSKTRTFKTKSTGAQEAHEAIRPTDLNEKFISGDGGQQKLYDLIWKRTISSQMSDAELEKTIVKINISKSNKELIANGEIIKFDGFLKVYLEGGDDDNADDDNNKILPPLSVGENINLVEMNAKETFSRPPARYTEASLVKKLEEMGIGRPSTYAPTISTIQDRGYVEKADREASQREYILFTLNKNKIKKESKIENYGAERAKLFPTDIGFVVNDFLVKFFPEIINYNFTAKVEEEFDEISRGNKVWNKMISEFYTPFHKTIEDSADISRKEASQVRDLGTDPKTGKNIFAKIGRYGPMVQLGETESEEKPKFAALPKEMRLDTVKIEDILYLFDLPRVIGQNSDGQDVIAQIGRFGPYVKSGKTFASITDEEIYTITLLEALAKVKEREDEKKSAIIHDFTEAGIQVLKGRFGPYITDGSKNVKIPKGKEPESLKMEECQELIKNAPAKKKRAVRKKK